jgi:hypothetical protein
MRSSERYHLSNFKEEPYLVVKFVYRDRFEVVKRFQLMRDAEKYAASKANHSVRKEVYFVMEARTAYTVAPTTNPVIEYDFLTGEETTIIGVE